jgi:hypothetical protein
MSLDVGWASLKTLILIAPTWSNLTMQEGSGEASDALQLRPCLHRAR